MPLWTVDQAALFRARCLHPEDCVPLNDRIAPRFPLPGCIKAGHTIDHGVRLDSRGRKARYDISCDSERRPLIRLRNE